MRALRMVVGVAGSVLHFGQQVEVHAGAVQAAAGEEVQVFAIEAVAKVFHAAENREIFPRTPVGASVQDRKAWRDLFIQRSCDAVLAIQMRTSNSAPHLGLG